MTGTGAMGCVPGELATRATNGGCSAEVQRAGALYNPQLDKMLKGLNKKLGKYVFISANNGQMHLDFINNPRAFGIYLPSHIVNLDVNLFRKLTQSFMYHG